MYHMDKKNEANALVIECITTALLEMMRKQSFDSITITDLTKRAGVGRVSFYRNFTSKKEILARYLDKLLQEWGSEFESKHDPSFFSESFIRHFYKYKDFYLLLYRCNLSEMIYESLRQGTKLDDSQNNMERYLKSMTAGMLFGWVDEWMRQGMPENPDEIILLSAQAAAAEQAVSKKEV